MAGVLDALASYVQNMLTEMARDEVHMLLGVTGRDRKNGYQAQGPQELSRGC